MNQKDIDNIIERAKKKDERAFTELYEMYSKRIHFIINKVVKNSEESNDVLTISMYKAFKSIDKYSPEYSFMTWLGRIARNSAIDYVRKEKKHFNNLSIEKYNDNEDDDSNVYPIVLIEDSNNPFEDLIKSDKVNYTHKLINKIPAKYQTYIKLRYIEEKTYDEISDKLDMPLGTVKGHLFYARNQLKKAFEDSSSEYKELVNN